MILYKSRIDNITQRLLLAFLVICPVYFHSGIFMGFKTLRVGQEQFFQIAATVLYAVFLVPNVFLASFLIWACFLFAYWGFPNVAGAYVLNILFATIVFHVFYLCAKESFADRCFNALKWLVFVNIVFMALQACNFDPVYFSITQHIQNKDLVGIMGLKAFNGMFLALMVPVIAYSNLFLGLLLLFPIALCESSAALIAACLCLFLTVFYEIVQTNKKVFFGLIGAIVVFCGFYVAHDYKSGMFYDRMSLWRVVIQDSVKRPVTGYGLDSFRHVGGAKDFMYLKEVDSGKSYAFKYHPETNSFIPPKEASKTSVFDPWDHPHNELVSLFFEFGVIGLILIYLFGRDIWRRYQTVPVEDEPYYRVFVLFFLALLVNSMAHFPFHVARVGYLIPVMLGLFYGMTDPTNEKEF